MWWRKTDRSSWQAGLRVRLSGVAYNAKAGAIIMIDEEPVYLLGLKAWDESVLGQQVRVEGIIDKKEIFPVSEPDLTMQSMETRPWVLREYKIK